MSQPVVKKDLIAINGYIRNNYYKKLKKKESKNRNIIIDNGVILIIHSYCKPLLLTFNDDAWKLSGYTNWNNPAEDKSINDHNKYISEIRKDPTGYKFVVVGAPCVGKTCLLISYTTNSFPGEYIPSIFDNYSANVKVDRKVIRIGLWDTAGGGDLCEGTVRLRRLSYPLTDVFMVCMSIYDKRKCRRDKMGMWTDNCIDTMAVCQEVQTLCPGIPCVLVGTKIDLRDDVEMEDDCYTKEEMETFAEIWNCVGYIECSAMYGTNVKGTFDYVIRKAFRDRKQLLAGPQKDCIIL